LGKAKSQAVDADPVFISTAIDENAGNLDTGRWVSWRHPANGGALKAHLTKPHRGEEGAQ